MLGDYNLIVFPCWSSLQVRFFLRGWGLWQVGTSSASILGFFRNGLGFDRSFSLYGAILPTPLLSVPASLSSSSLFQGNPISPFFRFPPCFSPSQLAIPLIKSPISSFKIFMSPPLFEFWFDFLYLFASCFHLAISNRVLPWQLCTPVFCIAQSYYLFHRRTIIHLFIPIQKHPPSAYPSPHFQVT